MNRPPLMQCFVFIQTTHATLVPSCRATVATNSVLRSATLLVSRFYCTLLLRFPPRALFTIAVFHFPLRSAFPFILHLARLQGTTLRLAAEMGAQVLHSKISVTLLDHVLSLQSRTLALKNHTTLDHINEVLLYFLHTLQMKP